MKQAPYHSEIARNNAGAAHWVTTSDGVRIRVGHWPAEDARGTVLLFPGRTEYIEKYGPAAADFTRRGYAVVAIDWRGQGLADRLTVNPAVGHVEEFSDYQHDAKAALAHARALGLPEPYHMVAHSMGGCIGLRSLIEDFPVKSAVFSAPMWGIRLSAALRPIAWGLSSLSRPLGFSHVFAPGQSGDTYVLRAEVEDNTLTSDPEMFAFLREQLTRVPELALGGPSLHWLNEALRETRHLCHVAPPTTPTLTFLGGDEEIVDPARVHQRMSDWTSGELVLLPGGRHEVMMETLSIRTALFDRAVAQFDAYAPVIA